MTDTAGQHRKMAEFLRDNQEKLLARWCELASASGARYTSAARFAASSATFTGSSSGSCRRRTTPPLGELKAALAELSRSRAREGATPGETALSVFTLKDAVYELVADAAELVPEFLAFSRMIDDLGLHTFETYAAAREQIITDQAESMLELSTPVVRLWDGIIAVPLVGTLDSARTQLVMEKMLDALVATGAEHAVIDITGVPTVDTEVAQHLLKTVMAARLLGRRVHHLRHPAADRAHHRVARHRVRRHRRPRPTLADALAHALSRSGLRVGPA